MHCKRGRSTARKKEKTKAEMEADMEKAVIRDCETGEELPFQLFGKNTKN